MVVLSLLPVFGKCFQKSNLEMVWKEASAKKLLFKKNKSLSLPILKGYTVRFS